MALIVNSIIRKPRLISESAVKKLHDRIYNRTEISERLHKASEAKKQLETEKASIEDRLRKSSAMGLILRKISQMRPF